MYNLFAVHPPLASDASRSFAFGGICAILSSQDGRSARGNIPD